MVVMKWKVFKEIKAILQKAILQKRSQPQVASP